MATYKSVTWGYVQIHTLIEELNINAAKVTKPPLDSNEALLLLKEVIRVISVSLCDSLSDKA